MLYYYSSGSRCSLSYDSSNRLLSAMSCTYTYNAENTRIKKVYGSTVTTYVYNTVAKLSQLLVMKKGSTITKYVYGLGLIGEECNGTYKTYHFDYRGSTVALTNTNGVVTNRFTYDTYGKLTEGSSNVTPFLYNGRDGVITDENGLYYMRARYYSPDLFRFVNADIVRGTISDAVTLNRYAYADCNPVSKIDPFGLNSRKSNTSNTSSNIIKPYTYLRNSFEPIKKELTPIEETVIMQQNTKISDFGTVVYNGETYNVFVPINTNQGLQFRSSTSSPKTWTTVDTIRQTGKRNIDWAAALVGAEFDDFNGALSGPDFGGKWRALGSVISLFVGLCLSFGSNTNVEYVDFEFQHCGNERRVIIRAGSTEAERIYNQYATGISHSSYFANSGYVSNQVSISNRAEAAYERMTGKNVDDDDAYDFEITVDTKHAGSGYTSYLWKDASGTIMQYPIIYENDKIEIGRRTGFLNLGFKSMLDVPLELWSPASDDITSLFNKATS